MMLRNLFWGLLILSLVGATMAAEPLGQVVESARQIPVAHRVDVVVVGGSTGAVSAALAAAQSGAKVFLAAPYPYLGEDMTATLRLWLEEGERPTSPLAQKIFSETPGEDFQPDRNRLELSYQVDVPSDPKHRDTKAPSLLTDGQSSNPASQSVQYNSDATITAELKKVQPVRELRVVAWRRYSGDKAEFDVAKVVFSISEDGKNWKQVGEAASDSTEQERVVFSTKVNVEARLVKFEVKKAKGASRMLLGEIEVIGPPTQAAVGGAPKKENTTPPRPLHVKKVLDDVLLGAKIPFLFSCYATDVLRDAQGQPCGVVIANRAGRQAVIAKVIIDATDRAVIARAAGAKFQPYPAGIHTFKRVVIGGSVREGANLTARKLAAPFAGPHPNPAKTSSGFFDIIEYTLQLPMADDGPAAWATADQRARTLTYHPEQQFTSERLFEVPPDSVISGAGDGNAPKSLTAFQPAEVKHLWILSGCADISREQAEKLLRPCALIDLGEQMGKAAAAEVAKLPQPTNPRLAGKLPAKPLAEGEVRESLQGLRPGETSKPPTIPQEGRGLPVLGKYDVVVIGGGTGGAPAGIGAARQGARTLVIEYLHGLGGVGTQGAISGYYWGNRVGFSSTVVDGKTTWAIEPKMEWYRQKLLEAKADIWFGTIGCGALVADNRVIGAVVATPEGRGVVLAKAVIDGTGNSDVAAVAGAETIYTDASDFGMQGTGLPPRNLGATYANTDFTITDETDMVDIWQIFVFAKTKYLKAFDQGRLIDTRERRRIVGDATITLIDEINGRTYPDTVVQTYSDYDTHGYTVDPYLLLEHPQHAKGFRVNVPYRAMLPRGMEGVLVIGLGISAHRDAVPLIRMQADIQNGGYAAGVAAAMAAKEGSLLRGIDLDKLKKHLVDAGNLTPSVLKDQDSYPLSDEKIQAAVDDLTKGTGQAAAILVHPDRALPLLKKAYAGAQAKDKLVYAKALAVLGDGTGLETLVQEIKAAAEWDQGWNYRGMGQFGSALSPLDILIAAAGRTGNKQALPVILDKVKLLSAESEFSHHRAAALALEKIGDPAAAKPLADLLAKPDMTGHVHSSIDIAIEREKTGGTNGVKTRRESLRELMLARALYRCGDYNGVGRKILESYVHDLRGHLSRHAQAVLKEGEKK